MAHPLHDRVHVQLGSLSRNDVVHSENFIGKFPSHLVCKICTNYRGIKLALAFGRWKEKMDNFLFSARAIASFAQL